MQFYLVDNIALVPNQMYYVARAWDVDRDGILRKGREPTGPYKFVRIHDIVAEIIAQGNQPMSYPPPAAVFEYTDEDGQPVTFELSFKQSNYVLPLEPPRSSERSGVGQFKSSMGGRKRRAVTSSSRARRRSRTRKSRRAAGGGR